MTEDIIDLISPLPLVRCQFCVKKQQLMICEDCRERIIEERRLRLKKEMEFSEKRNSQPKRIRVKNSLKRPILRRDGHTCVICYVQITTFYSGGDTYERSVDIHYIDGNKKNNDLRNLISLCRSCHKKNDRGDCSPSMRVYFSSIAHHRENLKDRLLLSD